MLYNMLLLGDVRTEDVMRYLTDISGGIFLFVVVFVLFLVSHRLWKNWRIRVQQRGYPGLKVYLLELPQTDEKKLDAIELAMKGVVICVLGVLFPPLIVVGVVPLYYGGRKLAAIYWGLDDVDGGYQDEQS